MTFVNEYVSKDDIKRHGFDRIYFDNHPASAEIPETYRPDWTIDRDNSAVLRKVGGANTARESEHWIEFRLDIRDQSFYVKLNRGQGSGSYRDVPYRIVWDRIVAIDPQEFRDVSREEMLTRLKEGLTVYGDGGVHSYVRDVLVTFNF